MQSRGCDSGSRSLDEQANSAADSNEKRLGGEPFLAQKLHI